LIANALKKIFLWILWTLLIGLSLLVLFFVLLRSSKVQTYFAHHLANYLTTKTGNQITIGKVYIYDFLKVDIQQLQARDQHDSLYVDIAHLKIEILPRLLRQNLLYIKNVELSNASIFLIQYAGEDEINLIKMINKLLPTASSDTSQKQVLAIKLENFEIRNTRFGIDLQDYEHYQGMDYVHLNIDSLNLHIQNFEIRSDSLMVNIIAFSAYEKCGFHLKSFSGKTIISPRELEIPDLKLEMNESKLNMHLRFEYQQWDDWNYFVDKIVFNSQLDSCKINFNDFRFFASEFTGMDNTILTTTTVKGSIANISLKNTTIDYGAATSLQGNFSFKGLPDFDQTFMRLKIKLAQTNLADLSSIKIGEDKYLSLDETFKKFGNISVNGRFTGFYYDFVSNADFNTAIGKLSTDLSLQSTKNTKQLRYSGKLNAENFNLGSLLNNQHFGNLSMEANMSGTGLTADLEAAYHIKFDQLEISGTDYNQLQIDGKVGNRKITAIIDSKNQGFSLMADGSYDFSSNTPHIILASNIRNARISRLLMLNKDTLGDISVQLKLDIQGTSLENFQGKIEADSILYKDNKKRYYTDSVMIETQLVNGYQQLEIRSPYLDAKASGLLPFSQSTLLYKLIFSDILPNLMQPNSVSDIDIAKWKAKIPPNAENLKLDVQFGNTDDLSELFMPDLKIYPNSSVVGSYNYREDKLDLQFTSDQFAIAGFSANSLDLKIGKENGEMQYQLFTPLLQSENQINLDSLKLAGNVQHDSITFNMDWGLEQNNMNDGHLNGKIAFESPSHLKIKLNEGFFNLHDSTLTLKPDANIELASHLIRISEIQIFDRQNSFTLDGIVSDNPKDVLDLNFDHFDLSFFDIYLKSADTDIDGIITGKLSFSNMWTQPDFLGNFKVSDFRLNGEYLHDMQVSTLYDRTREALALKMNILSKEKGVKYLSVEGDLFPYRINNQLDLAVRLQQFPLKSIQNYLSSFSSKVDGVAEGSVLITGSFSQPKINGKLHTAINDILIDYTNVNYTIDDSLIFTPDYFGFLNAKAKDLSGNSLNLTTQIFHQFFRDFSLHIDVQPDKAQLLNTTEKDNELFYGKAQGSGSFTMDGSFNDLKLGLKIAPTGDSYIAIPISYQLSAEESDFLKFVIKDSNLTMLEEPEELNPFLINMDMEVNVDPSTRIELVMDKKVGDVISARGDGKISINYDKDGNLSIFGTYVIDRGNYLFTLQNIINKRFVIQPGSTIKWDGDLEDAQINLKAIYQTEAKLWDLLQQIDSSSVYKKPSKVDCGIDITGNLYNPSISFFINLPNESVATRELVNSLLSAEATGNSEELNKNFVSLLVLGHFLPPSGFGAGSNPNAISNNAYELLAEQVGNLLNQLSDEVEIGVEWSPGDDITTQEIAVALSYSLLNDRLLIDGKFGTGGGSTNEDASTRIVGDVNIQYKISKDGRIRALIFNRTNYYDPVSRKAPYTQGVGVSFRKDFSSFKELWRSNKKKEVSNIK
jgi:autotransporter translocation and assembly factor TamB